MMASIIISIAIIIIILICFKIMSVLLKIFSAKSNKKKILVTMINTNLQYQRRRKLTLWLSPACFNWQRIGKRGQRRWTWMVQTYPLSCDMGLRALEKENLEMKKSDSDPSLGLSLVSQPWLGWGLASKAATDSDVPPQIQHWHKWTN